MQLELFSEEQTIITLNQIFDSIQDCQRCSLAKGRKNIVFGAGNPNAKIVFVGEGPGANEDKLGKPFVGRSGNLLDNIFADVGLNRADVYITNIVKCRPPENRDPEVHEVWACHEFLNQQLAAIDPKVIVALGLYASRWFSNSQLPMNKLRQKTGIHNNRAKVFYTYHPAFALRNPSITNVLKEDIAKAKTYALL